MNPNIEAFWRNTPPSEESMDQDELRRLLRAAYNMCVAADDALENASRYYEKTTAYLPDGVGRRLKDTTGRFTAAREQTEQLRVALADAAISDDLWE